MMKFPVWLLSTETSGRPFTTVRSASPLLAALTSPRVTIHAVLVTLGAAGLPGVTVRVKLVLPPGASGPGCVQDTTWPAALQVQPPPPPELKVSPVGSVSRTV